MWGSWMQLDANRTHCLTVSWSNWSVLWLSAALNSRATYRCPPMWSWYPMCHTSRRVQHPRCCNIPHIAVQRELPQWPATKKGIWCNNYAVSCCSSVLQFQIFGFCVCTSLCVLGRHVGRLGKVVPGVWVPPTCVYIHLSSDPEVSRTTTMLCRHKT